MTRRKPIKRVSPRQLNWIDGKIKPDTESECLVQWQIFDGVRTLYYRAPVSWRSDLNQWEDEWGITLDPEDVVRYVVLPKVRQQRTNRAIQR
jgi:hypothetical protein